MLLCPLLLRLPDQRLLTIPLPLLELQLVGSRYRELVVCAIENTQAEGGPSKDLAHVSIALPSYFELSGAPKVLRSGRQDSCDGRARTLTPTEVDMVREELAITGGRARVGGQWQDFRVSDNEALEWIGP